MTAEFVVFVLVLLVIAAAFDLWLIRAWQRARSKRRRAAGDAPPAGRAVPARTMIPPKPAAHPAPAEVSFVPKAKRTQPVKRGAKAVPRKATVAVPGKSGRTAHVNITMDLPEGESIRVTLESVGGEAVFRGEKSPKPAAGFRSAAFAPSLPPAAAPFGARWAGFGNLFGGLAADIRSSGRSLFAAALVLYLATRLIGLAQWPIYFFTDEAVQTNFAQEFWDNNFRGNDGELFPTFFENAGQYEMNLSVYVQVIPWLIFGKSVFVTRAVSVLITLLGMLAAGLILRRIFRLPYWWSGVLLLSIIPVWFLHSRTAFEPGESIAFYVLFLYFYMRAREDSPWLLLPALVFGTLSAYIYSPSQVTVAVTGGLLLISDARYHWRHKWISLAGLGLLVVLALPYLRFLYLHPEANRDQLVIVSSYWVNDISFWEKLKLFAGQYLSGLDPRYWFLANPPEGVPQTIVRHLMKGYGHIMLWTLPFLLVGIGLCLGNLRSSKFRTVLITLLAAPTGGAIAQITISRTLVTVIPAALLTALGVSWLLALLERPEDPPQPAFLAWWREEAARLGAAWSALRESFAERSAFDGVRGFLRAWRARFEALAAAARGGSRGLPRLALAVGVFAVLGSVNVYMLWDALANGPTWYQNYELYGMQWGGAQLTSALVDYRAEHPDDNLIVSSSWANGTDEIFRFFLPENFPFQTRTVLEYIQNYVPIDPRDVFVMTSEEYAVATASNRFSDIQILQILNYPNGQPGFYFARLTYVPDIQEIIAAEKAELSKPVEEQVSLGGEIVRVVHSRFDMGELGNGFDGNPYSLIRTQQDNPMSLDMFFPVAHTFTKIVVRVGGAPTRLTVRVYPAAGGGPVEQSIEVERSSDYRDMELTLAEPIESSHITLEIETVGESAPTHVHVYEIRLEGVGWKNGTAVPSA
jgi:hypothetical protein